jgi:DNA polymerase I-like protein with 3'-5' exonuclease and polymerase domains
MGDEKLVLAARKQYGVIITVQESRELKKLWLDMYPEMREYFRRINQLGRDNEYTIEHLFTKLLRGKIPYCAACNSPFQGLVATMMKNAGYMISHACYNEPGGPLDGCFVVNEVHDEIVIEVPIPRVHPAAEHATTLWLDGARPYLPDVPPTAHPVAMTVWSKNAEATFDATGQLIPWTP